VGPAPRRTLKAHEEALGVRQGKVLAALAPQLEGTRFHLAGGTAVALWLGHRRSVDFDWFTPEPLGDPLLFARQLQQDLPFHVGTVARGTLHGTLYGVRLTFLEYRYRLLEPPTPWPEQACELASLRDLACMKLSAISQRGAKKDFLDLHALGTAGGLDLPGMLADYREKYETRDIAHVLYALTYFDDAERERTPAMFWPVRWPEVRETIRSWVGQATRDGV
jgi:hypothetical protein